MAPSAWSVATEVEPAGQWMQMDLGATTSVIGLVTQGGPRHFNTMIHGAYGSVSYTGVTSFTVESSADGVTFATVPGTEAFTNAKRDAETKSRFPAPVMARYIRIIMQTWEGSMSMRADVIVDDGTCAMQCDCLSYSPQ